MIILTRIETRTLGKNPFARNVIDLEPNPGRVFEQNRIIPRRPRAFLRGMNDLGFAVVKEGVNFIDIFSTASPKT
jgi:hypothetical protein